MNDVLSSLTIEDVLTGAGKAFFFGYFVAIVACWNGLRVEGGADGVGRATTNTVVICAILVVTSDFFLTQLFHLILS
jgi:phospholipid/cholesterol/gamma-HCH transport system permease protein